MDGYSCSLSAHNQNVLGQCAQWSPPPIRSVAKGEGDWSSGAFTDAASGCKEK